MTLLNANQKLKLQLSQESASIPIHTDEKHDVEAELAIKRAEVVRNK